MFTTYGIDIVGYPLASWTKPANLRINDLSLISRSIQNGTFKLVKCTNERAEELWTEHEELVNSGVNLEHQPLIHRSTRRPVVSDKSRANLKRGSKHVKSAKTSGDSNPTATMSSTSNHGNPNFTEATPSTFDYGATNHTPAPPSTSADRSVQQENRSPYPNTMSVKAFGTQHHSSVAPSNQAIQSNPAHLSTTPL